MTIQDWLSEANRLAQSMQLPSKSFPGVIVDIALAHGLGATPQQAAEAVMGHNPKLLRRMLELMPLYDEDEYLREEPTNGKDATTHTQLEGLQQVQVPRDPVQDCTR